MMWFSIYCLLGALVLRWGLNDEVMTHFYKQFPNQSRLFYALTLGFICIVFVVIWLPLILFIMAIRAK